MSSSMIRSVDAGNRVLKIQLAAAPGSPQRERGEESGTEIVPAVGQICAEAAADERRCRTTIFGPGVST